MENLLPFSSPCLASLRAGLDSGAVPKQALGSGACGSKFPKYWNDKKMITAHCVVEMGGFSSLKDLDKSATSWRHLRKFLMVLLSSSQCEET